MVDAKVAIARPAHADGRTRDVTRIAQQVNDLRVREQREHLGRIPMDIEAHSTRVGRGKIGDQSVRQLLPIQLVAKRDFLCAKDTVGFEGGVIIAPCAAGFGGMIKQKVGLTWRVEIGMVFQHQPEQSCPGSERAENKDGLNGLIVRTHGTFTLKRRETKCGKRHFEARPLIHLRFFFTKNEVFSSASRVDLRSAKVRSWKQLPTALRTQSTSEVSV